MVKRGQKSEVRGQRLGVTLVRERRFITTVELCYGFIFIYAYLLISISDLIKEGATLGIAAGQPFIASEIGNDTQTNFEVYYNYPINDFIAIAPILQVITNASNQDANDTIYTGTIRTVFNF